MTENTPTRPVVFVACATDDLTFAKAIKRSLGRDAIVKTWQEVFDNKTPSQSNLDVLISAAQTADFAIIIFSPIDGLSIVGNEMLAPRDNVVFEYGLFTGILGKDRVFLVRPSEHLGYTTKKFRIMTDVTGISVHQLDVKPKTEPNLEDHLFQVEMENIISTINKISFNRKNQIERAEDVGLIEVFQTRKSSGDSSKYGRWDTYLDYKSSSNQIDFMGISLEGIFRYDPLNSPRNIEKEFGNLSKYPRIQKIIERINNGTQVRIILPSPDSRFLEIRKNTERNHRSEARWKEVLDLSEKIWSFIISNYLINPNGSITIKNTPHILYNFMCRSGDKMIVAPYVSYATGDKSPAMVLDQSVGESQWFKTYLDDFEEFFNDSDSQIVCQSP
jgi:predicted nucleotide-binding protein